jgi:hypothetical protein
VPTGTIGYSYLIVTPPNTRDHNRLRIYPWCRERETASLFAAFSGKGVL